MPRVVPNQKEKFETDEFMKRHSREGEVRNIESCTQSPESRLLTNINLNKKINLVVCHVNVQRGVKRIQ